jgi:uncharacterized membrane protein
MPPLDSQTIVRPLPKLRYVYIDLLRGWAVLVMIETHVTNTFMVPAIRLQPWFDVLNFVNGIVAPSFLFVAGYSFAIVGQRKWNDYLSMNGVFWKQVGRILQIWAVGYALHLPFFSFNKLAFLIGWDEWRSFWPVDVLQCIAFSLLVILFLVLITRNHRVFLIALFMAGCAVAFASPFMSTKNVDGTLSLPFSSYINSLNGSLFPIFPWMGFVLFGGAAGELFARFKSKMPERKFFIGVLAAGIVLVVLSVIANLLPVKIFPSYDFWTSSPEFFFVRLGVVLIILAALWGWEQRAHSGKSVVSLLGSESLVTYTGHLLVIYGLFIKGESLAIIIGATRSVPEVAGMTIILIGAMAGIAYFWNSLKKKSMLYARVLQYSILAIVLLVFFTKPY